MTDNTREAFEKLALENEDDITRASDGTYQEWMVGNSYLWFMDGYQFAQARIAELEKDAERYRWLIKNVGNYMNSETTVGELTLPARKVFYHETDIGFKTLTEALDKAIAESKRD